MSPRHRLYSYIVLLALCCWATIVCAYWMIFEGLTKAYSANQSGNLLFLKTKRKPPGRTKERAFVYLFRDGL
jgi:hypothetical protein